MNSFYDIETDMMLEDLILEASESDKEQEQELKKRKRELAKKIAKTLVIIAGLSAIIIACKKSGDKNGEKKIKEIKDTLTKETKNIKLDEIKTAAQADAAENKLDRVAEKANKVKKYKLADPNHWEGFKYDEWGTIPGDLDSAKTLRKSPDYDKYTQELIDYYENRARKNYDKLKKGIEKRISSRTHTESEEYIVNMYKYNLMIESVCDRFDNDMISYETTMEIIDTICENAQAPTRGIS